MAVSTIGTVLKFGTSTDSLTKLTRIKSYPDLLGAPDTIEVTDLEDEQQTFVPGVRSSDNMEFTANYTLEEYTALAANEGTDGYFQVEFGEDGKDGIFRWKGVYYVTINAGDVNAAREMTIVVTPSSKPELVSSSSSSDSDG